MDTLMYDVKRIIFRKPDFEKRDTSIVISTVARLDYQYSEAKFKISYFYWIFLLYIELSTERPDGRLQGRGFQYFWTWRPRFANINNISGFFGLSRFGGTEKNSFWTVAVRKQRKKWFFKKNTAVRKNLLTETFGRGVKRASLGEKEIDCREMSVFSVLFVIFQVGGLRQNRRIFSMISTPHVRNIPLLPFETLWKRRPEIIK